MDVYIGCYGATSVTASLIAGQNNPYVFQTASIASEIEFKVPKYFALTTNTIVLSSIVDFKTNIENCQAEIITGYIDSAFLTQSTSTSPVTFLVNPTTRALDQSLDI